MRRTASRGFTLVELLVVIGIIGVLVAILLPAMSNARWRARVMNCTANLRAMAQACNNYANTSDGYFPTPPMGSTAGLATDVPTPFYKVLRKEGIAHEAFWCPAAEDNAVQMTLFQSYPHFVSIGYSVWIARWNGPTICPPKGPGAYPLPSPTPKEQAAGPSSRQDPAAKSIPIITDLVATDGTPPSNADLTVPGSPYTPSPWSHHQRHGRLVEMNAVHADGHVEAIAANTLRPRYWAGQFWFWR